MEEDYCPIKYRNIFFRVKCRATGEKCDHIECVERIRKYQPNAYKKKFEKWEAHRRGEIRWRDKNE